MPRLFLLVVIGLFSMVAGPVLAEDAHVSIVKNASGSVEVRRGEGVLQASPGMQLMASDEIVSGKDSTAGIVFVDGTRLSIGASSQVKVSQYLFDPKQSKYDFSLYVKKGSVIYSSGRLGKLAPDKVSLKTPRATVGIRGTRFVVTVD